MTRRPLAPPPALEARAGDRMAPGGRRSAAESPVRPFHRPVKVAGVPPVVPPVLPQFWWKFDEASGLFHDSVTGTTMTAGIYGAYLRPPLAPDSVYSMGTGVGINVPGHNAPPITPGPGGWIVFDWWVSGWTQVLDGRQVDVNVCNLNSDGSFDGTIYPYLHIRFTALNPDVWTPTLRFNFGGTEAFSPDCVLAVTGWPDPARFRWKINPAADTWQVWMGETLMGSGTTPIIWGGNWGGGFGATVGSFFDEFKVYGE